jgi:hypothetical protein
MGLLSNGVLSGLGQGLQIAGALQFERAKTLELERIRRADRKDRMEDARALAKWEMDQKQVTDVTDESGNLIGQRGPDNSFTPVEARSTDRRAVDDAFTLYRLITDNGKRDTTLNPFTEDEARALSTAQQIIMGSVQGQGADGISSGGGSSAVGGSGIDDDELLARLREEGQVNQSMETAGAPENTDGSFRPFPRASAAFGRAMFGDEPDGSLGGLLGFIRDRLGRSGPEMPDIPSFRGF